MLEKQQTTVCVSFELKGKTLYASGPELSGVMASLPEGAENVREMTDEEVAAIVKLTEK